MFGGMREMFGESKIYVHIVPVLGNPKFITSIGTLRMP